MEAEIGTFSQSGTITYANPKRISGDGNRWARIAFIGAAPGKAEMEQGKPFVGSAGRILRNQLLRSAGISESDCFFDYMCPEWRPDRWEPDFAELAKWALDLRQRLRNLPNLNCIVAVGTEALQVLSLFETYEDKNGRQKPLSITNWRGSIKKSRLTGHKFIAIIDPATYRHNPGEYRYLHVSISDIERAWQEAQSPVLALPERVYEIIYDTDRALEVLKEIAETKRWAFDTETSIACVGFSRNPNLSQTIVFESIEKPGFLSPAGRAEIHKFLKKCFTLDHEIVTQFGLFDMDVMEADYGINPLRWKIFSDTGYKHGLLYPELPHNLGFLTSQYTRTPFYKDEGRRFKRGRDPEKKFFEYNGKDCCITLEADNKMEAELQDMGLTSYYYNNIMPLVPVLYRMQRVGITVDRKSLDEIRRQLKRKEIIERIKLLRAVGFEPNPRSPIDNEKFLQAIGCPKSKITRGKNGKVKCDEDFLNRLKIDLGHPAIEIALNLRSSLYLQSNFTKLKCDAAGRYHAVFKLGPKSGRLASEGKGHGPQLQNIPERGTVNLRTIFVPSTNKALVHADLSQADARVFAYFAQIQGLIDIYESDDPDSHSVICSFLMGIPRDQIIKGKLNDDKRQITKMACHAFDYGMRERRLVVQCRKEGIDLDTATASVWRSKYLKRFSEIEPHWEWIQEELKRTRTLTDLMGRKYLFLGEFDEPMYREAYSRVPQGTVAGVLAKAMIDFDAAITKHYGHDFHPDRPEQLIQVHDSLEIECHENAVEFVAKLLRNCIEIPLTAHGRTFTIPAEFEVAYAKKGQSWGKMERL